MERGDKNVICFKNDQSSENLTKPSRLQVLTRLRPFLVVKMQQNLEDLVNIVKVECVMVRIMASYRMLSPMGSSLDT